MNPFHRNFKGFDEIQSSVSKDHVRKFPTKMESLKNHMLFLNSKGGLKFLYNSFKPEGVQWSVPVFVAKAALLFSFKFVTFNHLGHLPVHGRSYSLHPQIFVALIFYINFYHSSY
jgi:hypothetical protein